LEIKSLVESLLFVADEPVAVERLASAIGVDHKAIEDALRELSEEYEQRGLRLQRKKGWVQMITAPEASPHIERFLGLELTSRLSAPALETLAIVAYQQPVTRAGVEAVRGVNCDSVLRTLVSKGLAALSSTALLSSSCSTSVCKTWRSCRLWMKGNGAKADGASPESAGPRRRCLAAKM
jgi:segregation and condensation protein B